jgi:hypothetical protein
MTINIVKYNTIKIQELKTIIQYYPNILQD